MGHPPRASDDGHARGLGEPQLGRDGPQDVGGHSGQVQTAQGEEKPGRQQERILGSVRLSISCLQEGSTFLLTGPAPPRSARPPLSRPCTPRWIRPSPPSLPPRVPSSSADLSSTTSPCPLPHPSSTASSSRASSTRPSPTATSSSTTSPRACILRRGGRSGRGRRRRRWSSGSGSRLGRRNVRRRASSTGLRCGCWQSRDATSLAESTGCRGPAHSRCQQKASGVSSLPSPVRRPPLATLSTPRTLSQ